MKLFTGKFIKQENKIIIFDGALIIGSYDLSTDVISYDSSYEKYCDDICNKVDNILFNYCK